MAVILRKPDDVTRTGSSLLVLDTVLVLPALVSELWIVEYGIFYTTQLAAGMRFQINVPSGASGYWSMQYQGETSGIGHFKSDALAFINPIDDVDNNALGFLTIYASVLMGGTAGNIELYWAQKVSDASDTTVHEGSYLIGHRQS